MMYPQNLKPKVALWGMVTISALFIAATQNQSEDPIVLAFKSVPGETLVASTTIENKMNISGAVDMNMNQSIQSTSTITYSAGEDGWMKFEGKMTDVSFKSDNDFGQNQDELIAMSKKVVISGLMKPDGSQKDYKIVGPEEVTGTMHSEAGAILGFMGFTFPKDAISVGHTWIAEGKIPAASGAMVNITGGTIKATYTLKSTEIKDGHLLATIDLSMINDMTVDSPAGSGKVHGDSKGFTVFDVTEGHLVNMDMKGSTESDMGQVSVKADIATKIAFKTSKP